MCCTLSVAVLHSLHKDQSTVSPIEYSIELVLKAYTYATVFGFALQEPIP